MLAQLLGVDNLRPASGGSSSQSSHAPSSLSSNNAPGSGEHNSKGSIATGSGSAARQKAAKIALDPAKSAQLLESLDTWTLGR